MRPTLAALLTALALARPCAALAAEQRLEFDIAAGPLGAVLLEIAQAGGTVVSFSPNLVERRQAPAVRGIHTLLEALQLAAGPSGLVVERTSAGALTVTETPTPAQAPPPPPPGAAVPGVAGVPQDAAVAVLPRVLVLGSSGPSDVGLMAVRGSSATRTSTLLADLPQSVSVLTGEALELQGSPTSTEALRYVTGVASRIDLSGGQGIVPSLLIRGMPALYAMSGMGTIREALPMDNAFIERIEVPKGPSTVISGVSSFGGRGGVVNLVRKEAGGDPHRNFLVNLDTKDSGTVRAEADLAGQAGQGPAWRVVAYGSATGRTDGGYDGAGGVGLLGSLSYRQQDVSTTLTLHADKRRLTPAPTSRGGLLGAGGRISPVEDGQVDPRDARDRLLAGSADAELGVEWQVQPRWRVSLKTRVEAVDDDLRQHIPQGPGLVRRISWWSAALQGGLIGDVETGPIKHKLLLGVDIANWRMRLIDASGSVGVDARLGRFDTGDVKRELLLQDQARYGNLRVRLSAQAARVPVYVSTPGVVSEGDGRRAVNWDLGVLYRLSTSTAVYAGSQYAIESDIIRAVGSAIFEGNGDPTRTQQIQGGLKLDLLDERLALTLEAYRTEQTNVLSSPLFGSPGNSGDFFITPRRVVDGLEIDLAGRPWPALDVQLGFGYMRANDLLRTLPGPAAMEVNVPAGAIPARSMHLLSRYTLPESWMPGTRLGLAARARSSSFAIPPNPALPGAQLVLPGGALIDLSLERLFGPWALNVFVHNVFDRQIYETQSSPGYIPLEPRRSFGLTATYKAPGLRP
ncbi:MAG TPA: TonB-dependent receptor [Burkholderiaceae bacterium]|nr:TonB-dependent receptor [Burkholderiaceae bacterium]